MQSGNNFKILTPRNFFRFSSSKKDNQTYDQYMIRNPFLEEVFDNAVQINFENDETAEEYRRSSQRGEDSLFLEDV